MTEVEKFAFLQDAIKKIRSCYDWDTPENNEFYKWVRAKKEEGLDPSQLSYPNYILELIEPYFKNNPGT